jgi:hypothetical protein
MLNKTEIELLNIIHNSSDPQKVAEYAINLFLDYLRMHAPFQEERSDVLRVSS